MQAFCRAGLLLLTLALPSLIGCNKTIKPDPDETNEPPRVYSGLDPTVALQVEPAGLELPQGGKGKLTVTVSRRAYQGPIDLEMQNLPADVTAPRITLDATKATAEIELTASPTSSASTRTDAAVVLNARAVGKKETSRPLRISVKGPPFDLSASLGLVKLSQGARVKMQATVVRKGYQGPITVELVNPPANVQAIKATIPEGKDTVELEVTASTSTPLGPRRDVRLRGQAQTPTGTAQALSPTFTITVEEAPFTLQVLQPAPLLQGGKNTLKVRAFRKGYEGPIDVDFRNLPPGILAGKFTIPARIALHEVELKATFQVTPGPRGGLQVEGVAGSDIVYRTTSPAFALDVQPAIQLQVQPGAVKLAQADKTSFKINLLRPGKYPGPITVECQGLPAGVTGPRLSLVPDKDAAEVELTAVLAAALNPGAAVRIVASAPDLGNQVMAVANLSVSVVEAGSIPSGPFALKVPSPILKLTPGNKAILHLTALRRDYMGPITLDLRNLPALVTATKATIPANQYAADIEVTAPANAELGDKADVNVLGVGQPEMRIPSPNFTVTVQQHGFELRTQPAALHVMAGQTATLKVLATRKSHQGPIAVELRNLPPGLRAVKANLPAGQNEVEIEVVAEESAAPGVRSDIQLVGAADRELVSSPLTFHVEPGLFELKLEPEVVKIKHGTTAKVKVTTTRKGYQGPIPITLRNLPTAVTAPKAAIAKGENSVEIELNASFEAVERDTVDVAAAGTAGASAREVVSPCVTVSLVSFNPPPFEVSLEPAATKVSQGTAAKLKATVTRKGGFDGPITLELRNLPAGVTAAKLTVPMGKSSAEIELTALANAAPGTRTDVCVLATTSFGKQAVAQASLHVVLSVVKK
jgi:hypothetical protein